MLMSYRSRIFLADKSLDKPKFINFYVIVSVKFQIACFWSCLKKKYLKEVKHTANFGKLQ